MEEKTYQTLILAALLHDIGKFYARSSRVISAFKELNEGTAHPIISERIIEGKFSNCLKNIGMDIELLKKLIRHHHEDPRFPEECLVQSLSGAEKTLALIVSKADNYSSSERYEEVAQSYATYETALMDSIFSRVFSDSYEVEEKKTKRLKIKPATLAPENIFPQEIERSSWSSIVENFGRELGKIEAETFDGIFTILLSLIQKYCWSTPSDKTREVLDISLADHLKTTSAIAACLFKFHTNSNSLNQKEIENKEAEKFALICGDLSGIQQFIYDIAEVGIGGVAKRLRARSFKLSVLTEIAAHCILHELNLPISCLLFSSGGRFYILAPADSISINKLEKKKADIEKWLITNYQGEIAINIAYKKLKPTQFSSGGESTERFSSIWKSLAQEVGKSKLQIFKTALISSNNWTPNFISETEFEDDPEGVCRSCHKFPAIKPFSGSKICDLCDEDLLVGKKLVSAKYLLFYKDTNKGDLSFFDRYSIMLSDKAEEDSNLYLICTLNDTELNLTQPSTFKFIANYVPVAKNKRELESYCRNCREAEDCELKRSAYPLTLSFTCLAQKSKGSKYLGVLKADVDYLGTILAEGISDLSISRLTTFSNYLDLFFSGYIPYLMKNKYPDTYIVYAGGDDLLIAGPWDQMVSISKNIFDRFREFVCFNPKIDLSSGIILSRPGFPFSNCAELVSGELEKSKSAGRKRLSALGATFEWNNFNEIFGFGEMLVSALENKQVSSSFVYKLLTFEDMYQQTKKGDNSAYLYLPRLSYMIRRNLYDNKDEPKNKELIEVLKRLLKPDGEVKLMENLKFPVNYALLSHRGENGGETK